MLYSGLKEGEYTAQVTVYRGKVNAEIISSHECYHDRTTKLWICVMHKSFGRTFASQPRDKDWKAAREWAEKQLKYIKEHCTVTVTKPEWLNERERLAKIRETS